MQEILDTSTLKLLHRRTTWLTGTGGMIVACEGERHFSTACSKYDACRPSRATGTLVRLLMSVCRSVCLSVTCWWADCYSLLVLVLTRIGTGHAHLLSRLCREDREALRSCGAPRSAGRRCMPASSSSDRPVRERPHPGPAAPMQFAVVCSQIPEVIVIHRVCRATLVTVRE
jgi:hypothetical protein